VRYLANISWAYAHLEVANQPLLTSTAAAVKRRIPDFNMQHSVNTVWAFSVLNVVALPCIEAPAFAASGLQSSADTDDYGMSQHISNLAWSFSALKVFN